jgi:hypothetical protein
MTDQQTQAAKPDEGPDTSSGYTFVGWCLIGLGVVGVGMSLTLDISAPGYGSVANFDAMGQRDIWVWVSLALFIAGAIFVGAGHIVSAIRSLAVKEVRGDA